MWPLWVFPHVAAGVLGEAALAAAIERGHGIALRDVVELVGPLAAAAGIAMEHEHRGMRVGSVRRPQVLGMHAGAADAGEVEIEGFGKGRW